MKEVIFLPWTFIRFWFFDAPLEMIAFFASLNKAFLHLFSLPLFIRTFFQPLKNEYRDGLVWFSRAMGMFIKSILIVVDILLLFFMLLVEFTIVVSFIAWPFLTLWLLYI